MFDQFLSKASALVQQAEPFAVATVVRYQAPISGKPGDKAIIRADGSIWGWIGGGCVQPVVIQEALQSLNDGRPRLIRISPSAEAESGEGITTYTMTCHSGGTLDIYIEPVLPKPHLLVLGRSPVAQTLVRLARTVGYMVSVATPWADRESFPDADRRYDKLDLVADDRPAPEYVVVSTQGERDEEALELALRTRAVYVAFVASARKAAKTLDGLRVQGIAHEQLGRVRAPAGLDLHATSPEEIAVSILAEIVQVKEAKQQSKLPARSDPLKVRHTGAKDPVCGMTVEVSATAYHSEFQGRRFYFCCAGCKRAFENEPEGYAAITIAG